MGILVLTAITANLVCGASPTEAELAEARNWAAAKFDGVEQAPETLAAIEVLRNNDPVQLNSRAGKPMRISGKEYARGLYCHAVSELRVRLPRPGRAFEAVAGVDSNEQTSGGRGSVVFVVRVGVAEVWRSEVLREGMPGVPVSVPLNGAKEFVLAISDAGDDISCDQSDWADARALLEDGTTLWLGDLPLQGQARLPYTAEPFFSFTYDGRPSAEFLSSWPLERASERVDDARTKHTLTYRDPATGLVVRCACIAYHDFPSVEWTLYFKNEGAAATPVLSDIMAADTAFSRAGEGEFVLHAHKGDNCVPDSYEPYADTLGPGTDKRIANSGGRPTQTAFPYFNIATGGEGVIFVVSWAGQWAAQFTRDQETGLRLRAGQELTRFKLLPAEEVRTPMIVLQFWKGDRLHAQNVWRAWMISHNVPRPGGKLPPLPQLAACSSHQFGEMIHANSESQVFFVDKYLERGIRLDYWWMDAGWYVNKTGWPNTGTWEVDTSRFPGGLRPICDHAHEKGVRTLVWFEPERVTPGTWLYDEHPEWLLGRDGEQKLLNLGNPEACQWLTDHVDGLLNSEGIDLYRQDFNMDPLSYWRANDAEDRQGITEIRHVEGYFAYWDELRRRNPNMLIDSCASGGRRNDLETLRRAVPLLRSDYIMEPVGNQCHTHALSLWFPFYGTGTSKTDTYLVRSVLCPHFIACWDMRDEALDYANLASMIRQWKDFGQHYFGDYYPLTPYSLDDGQWIAWQFHSPELEGGMVQVFRRSDSIYEAARLRLNGLDPSGKYEVRNMDEERPVTISARELLDDGLPVKLPQRPAAVIFTYKRAK